MAAQATRSKKPYIGRRTGKVINIVARKNAHGFENIDDYFPDSASVNEEKSEKSQTDSENEEKPAQSQTGVDSENEEKPAQSQTDLDNEEKTEQSQTDSENEEKTLTEQSQTASENDEKPETAVTTTTENEPSIHVVGRSSRRLANSRHASSKKVNPTLTSDSSESELAIASSLEDESSQDSEVSNPKDNLKISVKVGSSGREVSVSHNSSLNADGGCSDHGDHNSDDHGDKNDDHGIPPPRTNADDGEHGDKNGDHSISSQTIADGECNEHGDKSSDDHSISPQNNADGEQGDKNGDHSISSQTSTDDGLVRKKAGGKLESVSTYQESENDDLTEQADGPRRSYRHRVPVLQYWKNERIHYEKRKSGWVVKDVIINPSPQVKIRKRKKASEYAGSHAKKGARANKLEEESELSETNIPEGFEEEVDPVGTVINPDTLKQVKMRLIHSGGMLDFQSPSQDHGDGNSDSKLLMDKYFSHRQFGAGQVLLRPGAEKGRQHVRNDTMVFHINSGRVLVTIHEDSFMLARGSSFFVPQGNVYNIKNLDMKKDACLFFTQIKG